MTYFNFTEYTPEFYLCENDMRPNGHLYVFTCVLWGANRAYLADKKVIRGQIKSWLESNLDSNDYLIELDQDSTSLGSVDKYFLKNHEAAVLLKLGLNIG